MCWRHCYQNWSSAQNHEQAEASDFLRLVVFPPSAIASLLFVVVVDESYCLSLWLPTCLGLLTPTKHTYHFLITQHSYITLTINKTIHNYNNNSNNNNNTMGRSSRQREREQEPPEEADVDEEEPEIESSSSSVEVSEDDAPSAASASSSSMVLPNDAHILSAKYLERRGNKVRRKFLFFFELILILILILALTVPSFSC